MDGRGSERAMAWLHTSGPLCPAWGAVRRCRAVLCCAARKIRIRNGSWLGFALIFSSGRHGRLRRSSLPLPHPIHLPTSMHPKHHPCREHSLEFFPLVERRGHSLFQPERAGISRFAHRCTLAVSPSVRLASFSGRCTIEPRSEAEWPGAVSGRRLPSVLRSHACCMGGGPCPCAHSTHPRFHKPSSRSNLAVADPEPRQSAALPQSPVPRPASFGCGGLATSKSGPCFINISKTECSP